MDAMPSGHVHLCEALCQTVERLYPGNKAIRRRDGTLSGLSPYSGAIDPTAAINVLVDAFRHGDLEAKIYSAEANRTFGLMRRDFEGFFPERLILSRDISCMRSDPSARYSDRTPFVSQASLSNWLACLKPITSRPPATGLCEAQFRIKNLLFDCGCLG